MIIRIVRVRVGRGVGRPVWGQSGGGGLIGVLVGGGVLHRVAGRMSGRVVRERVARRVVEVLGVLLLLLIWRGVLFMS